jgi:hypothetical protein
MASSTTTLTSTPNPSVCGEEVTFTAQVSPVPPDTDIPTGTVTFIISDDGPAQVVPLDAAGQASATVSDLSAGSHVAIAVYSGDGTYDPSTSPLITQVVNAATTTTTVTATPDPSVCGETVTVCATVTIDPPGSGIPTGTVTFTGPGGLNQAVVLDATGEACLTTSVLSSGTITATYSGDGCADTSVGTATVTVNPAATTTTVTATPDPSVCGETVTVCATVTIDPPGSGTPTGTVTFTGPGGLNQTVALDATGQACLTTTTLTSGTVTATYNGDSCAAGSSGTVAVTVNPATSSTILTVTPSPSVCGQTVTLTATVAVVPPGVATPTGSVTFFDGAVPLGTAPLVGNTATLSVPLDAGTHTLLAVYSGCGCEAGSTGSALTTVGKANTTTVLTTTPNPSVTGQTVTLTATVSPVAPGGGIPTGTVTFFDGLAPIGTAPVVGGVATLTKSNFTTGVHTLTASYSGSTCYNPSTSGAVLQQVVTNNPPNLFFATPGFGPRTGGGNVLLVGSNLASVTSVTFGGVPGTLLSVTGSLITVTAPPHAPGNVNVVAHSPAGSSNAFNYTYL